MSYNPYKKSPPEAMETQRNSPLTEEEQAFIKAQRISPLETLMIMLTPDSLAGRVLKNVFKDKL